MKLSTLLLGTVLAGGTLAAGAATLAKVGVAAAEEPQGVSLREESARHGRGFFYAYHSRSHRGGGLRGGK
jgi:hypothetical protein